jgi:hypothetical protein
MSGPRTLLAAAVVTVAAFVLYDATLLPGQDLGDTASFQATAGAPYLTPRQAYPLYYATGDVFMAAVPGEPARALNLASAVFGAIACGLIAVIVAALSGWAVAGAVAGLLYAVSYTFWSQAIIAEVYALHAFMTALSFVALLRWSQRPTLARLALFFVLYALGFGNHLAMVLLLPGFALFLLLLAPGGSFSMIRPRVAILAAGMAALGASQYAWNLRYLLDTPEREPGLLELFRSFWFDVTKADWRATMVMGIPEGALRDRFAMYWFDVHQQFGVLGIGLALIGVAWSLWPGRLPALRRSDPAGEAGLSRPRVGIALLVLLLVNWFFPFTYNVGDTHVFYLPAHFMVALYAGLVAGALLSLAAARRLGAVGVSVGGIPRRVTMQAAGAAVYARRLAPILAGLVLLAYPAWRAYDTFPALDRSRDWQVKQFFDRLTNGLQWNRTILASDLNWQLHNGMDYYAKYTRPDLGVADTTEALIYFPMLVASNREIDRDVAVTDGASSMLTAAYGPLFHLERDTRVAAPAFSDRVARFRPGTPYVLTLLQQYPDKPVDEADLASAVARLTGGTVQPPPSRRYTVYAGRVGERPTTIRSASTPFRMTARAGSVDADVRIECWLPADTIRRMGFGRVIVGRRPVLTLDRGVSFVVFDERGRTVGVEYGWTLLSPQPRWIIPARP